MDAFRDNPWLVVSVVRSAPALEMITLIRIDGEQPILQKGGFTAAILLAPRTRGGKLRGSSEAILKLRSNFRVIDHPDMTVFLRESTRKLACRRLESQYETCVTMTGGLQSLKCAH
jgi:hypothetical protein